jgi:hypothetical protein
MDEQSQPHPLSEVDPVLFRPESSGSDAFRLTVYLGVAVFSLSYLLSGRVDGILEYLAWVLILVFSNYFMADGTYNVAKLKWDESGGLMVDAEGIVDRSSWDGFGRVFWHEIKTIFPVSRSFFKLPTRHGLIGIDVTDSYLARKPRWIRFRISMNRRVFKAPDLQLSSRNLRETPEWILKVLQDRFHQYELLSISAAKQLESGN